MKYFVVSDIHSFAKELKKALKEAGFSKTNKDHTLIIVGDIFDRGESVWDTYNFVSSIPKSRRILIKGNHEQLYLDLLDKDYPEEHDFSNKTVETFCQIARMMEFEDSPGVSVCEFLASASYDTGFGRGLTKYIDEDCQQLWEEIKEKVKHSKITKFLKSTEWKNFYELDKFIFVHAFIPLKDTGARLLPAYYLWGHKYEYKSNWRESDAADWFDATWGCPWQLFQSGLFNEEAENGKVLVCGHWHTGDFYSGLDDNFKYCSSPGPIYFSKNLIGLDGGVFVSSSGNYLHPQNVLIIDENFNCYDKFLNKLVVD